MPCTCNFGGSPSPNHYCYAIFSLEIQKGHYGDIIYVRPEHYDRAAKALHV